MECKNCSGKLEENAGYCSYCGARVLDDKITLKFIISEVLDKVVNIDNRFLKTFLHLFSKPHLVIEDYIRGVRKRYFNPFNYLLISLTLAGITVLLTKEFTLNMIAGSSDVTTNPEGAAFSIEIMNFILDYQSFVTIVSIPFYAFVSWIVFLNREKFNYLEHNIIYIYTSAHLSIINFILVGISYLMEMLWYMEISIGFAFLFVIYNSYVLIRLFKLNFLQFIVKTLFFSVIGGFVYVLVVILLIVGILIFKGADYFKQFAPKQQKDSLPQLEQKIDSIPKPKENAILDFQEANSKLNCLS